MTTVKIYLRVGQTITITDPGLTMDQINKDLGQSVAQGFLSFLSKTMNAVIPWDNIASIIITDELTNARP